MIVTATISDNCIREATFGFVVRALVLYRGISGSMHCHGMEFFSAILHHIVDFMLYMIMMLSFMMAMMMILLMMITSMMMMVVMLLLMMMMMVRLWLDFHSLLPVSHSLTKYS